jgi:hypothetical protein
MTSLLQQWVTEQAKRRPDAAAAAAPRVILAEARTASLLRGLLSDTPALRYWMARLPHVTF